MNRTKNCVTAQSLKSAILNVRSLTNKSFVISQIIENHKLDIIFLTETWLDSNHNVVLNETSPPGFRYFSVPRLNMKGGGVACLFRNTLCCQHISLGDFETFEYLAVHLKSEQSVILLVLYHPPRLNKGFLDNFGELLSRILTDFEYVLITGDFNIHMDVISDLFTKLIWPYSACKWPHTQTWSHTLPGNLMWFNCQPPTGC